MGELHLEIIKERIIREYKIDVELGPAQISYKETLVGTAKHTLAVDRKIGNARQTVKLVMSAKTVKGVSQDKVLRLVPVKIDTFFLVFFFYFFIYCH